MHKQCLIFFFWWKSWNTFAAQYCHTMLERPMNSRYIWQTFSSFFLLLFVWFCTGSISIFKRVTTNAVHSKYGFIFLPSKSCRICTEYTSKVCEICWICEHQREMRFFIILVHMKQLNYSFCWIIPPTSIFGESSSNTPCIYSIPQVSPLRMVWVEPSWDRTQYFLR